jgi:hypothetical protein
LTLDLTLDLANLLDQAGRGPEAETLFRAGLDGARKRFGAADPKDNRFIDGRLISLALLEASRRAESGDTAGAWVCYRAVLRTITHFRRRRSTIQRQQAREASRPLQRRLTDWATGPRTTISQLRTALEVVLENEPKPEWDLYAVKYGYLELMGALGRPIPLSALQDVEGERTFRLGECGPGVCRPAARAICRCCTNVAVLPSAYLPSTNFICASMAARYAWPRTLW